MFETATTHNIQVQVESRFVPEQSQPENGEYFFAYKIQIRNSGPQTVQLVQRHWIIQDATGQSEEVKGPGVVGQQPHIRPNETFQYESFCPLRTPTGSMQGTYQMITEDGSSFDVRIPQFYLVEPGSYH